MMGLGLGMATQEMNGTDALSQVRVEIAGLTGRIDQVLIDHREQIAQNARNIEIEKRERIDAVKTLTEKLDKHSLISEKERATLAANVNDLQHDSAEYRTRFNSAWPRLMQTIAAVAGFGGFIYALWSSKGGV